MIKKLLAALALLTTGILLALIPAGVLMLFGMTFKVAWLTSVSVIVVLTGDPISIISYALIVALLVAI